MSNESIKVHINPYGMASATLKALVEQDPPYADWLRTALNRRHSRHNEAISHFWITSAQDLDASFVKLFREQSTPATRLLVMNETGGRQSTDNIFKRLMDLQIRSSERFYVADCSG